MKNNVELDEFITSIESGEVIDDEVDENPHVDESSNK